jgi:branched-chain amino acid transport system substrate-binding protein
MLFAALLAGNTARADGVIKIGDINSYKAMAANMGPYRKAVDLAVEQINSAGGVLGKKIEIVSRDDGANPGDAVRMADELLLNERVDLISGTILSHIGVAITDYAKQHKVFFLASASLTDRIVWESGNRYTFRLRPSTYTHAAVLVPYAREAQAQALGVRVSESREYGQSAVASFGSAETAARSRSSLAILRRRWKDRCRSVTQAVADAKPDAIFNVLFGADLAKFVREGKTRDLFRGVSLVSLLTGDPNTLSRSRMMLRRAGMSPATPGI